MSAIGSTRVFRSLLIHRCTIIRASRGTSSSSSYGHSKINFDMPEVLFQDVLCRFEPLSLEEMTGLGTQGRVTGTYWLWLPWESIPPGILAQEKSILHRVTNIKDRRSKRLIDAGPFDIDPLVDEAGASHHVRLMLRKTS